MKWYLLVVRHDNGTHRIKTAASTKEAAVHAVCMAESCPRNAIVSIKEWMPRTKQ